MAKKGKTRTVKKEKKSISDAIVHIQATFNNTIVTVSDLNGNVLAWASSGALKFRGAKKSTPYAAQVVTETAVKKAMEQYGIKNVRIYVKGPGIGRESAIRSVHALGLNVTMIKDVTPIPHNGCRPPKRRKV